MVNLKKINNKSMVQQVIDRLTQAILDKQLRPGDKIPTETELAESLGIGRSTVREAIKILVYIGVLEIKRAEGTYVCEGFSESMIDPMIYGIILCKEEDYDSLMELREMTEVSVLHLAILKNDEEGFAKVTEKLAALKEEFLKEDYDVDKAFEADNDFHDAVMAMGHNSLMEKINGIVRVLTYSMRKDSVAHMIKSGRGQELYAAHERICEIIKNKDESNLYEAIQETYFVEEK